MSKLFDFRKLSIPDRIRLVQEIWDSVLEEGPPAEVPPWQQAVLDRRLEELARSPDEVQPWEEVRAEVDRVPTGEAPCR